ncbi:MAG: hypothetical protein GY795_09040 [Desulfobacterales bacterium]|nr:hypothetical protein [Desulfobacterales bacterium]
MKFWHSLPCVLPKFHFGTPLNVSRNPKLITLNPKSFQNPQGLISQFLNGLSARRLGSWQPEISHQDWESHL